ncbi:hypothetical protein [Massilia rubra]|uniref:CDI immunity protein domain-containing protein n=1 Tax=Massilia rubra TaxID=2607910 RepID=A0ABX0LV65_9BURK|nr:hypothetical protein [Massilia rubra]NHZ36760.1 hypothetical protein [Massilia rubra]
MKNDKTWLIMAKEQFDAQGLGGADFYYLIETMLDSGKMSFPQLVVDAANGHGCTVREGLGYVLDQDWEPSTLFDEVSFFIGEMEGPGLSIGEFVALVQVASEAYCASFPTDADALKRNVEKLIHRYQR